MRIIERIISPLDIFVCLSIVFLLTGCSAEGSKLNYLDDGGFSRPQNSDGATTGFDGSAPFTPSNMPDTSGFNNGEYDDDASCASTTSVAEQIVEIVKTTETIKTPSPVTIYIMLDISQSMSRGRGTTKDDIARDSILDFIEDDASEGIAVALNYFPLPNEPLPEPESGEDDICPATGFDTPAVLPKRLPDDDHVDELTSALNLRFDGGGTPIQPALQGAVSYCKNFKEEDPFDTGEDCVVVFITDGEPQIANCTEDHTVISDIAGDAFDDSDSPVMTFAIGMEGANFNLLDLISDKGGTDCTPDDSDTYACNVDPDSDNYISLLDALELIREYVVDEIETEEEVITNVPVDCEWQLPEAEGDEEIDIDYVNIKFVNGETNEEEDIRRVKTEEDCTNELGWYYDDNDNPTRIIACPDSTCPHIQSVPESRIEILVGCLRNIELE